MQHLHRFDRDQRVAFADLIAHFGRNFIQAVARANADHFKVGFEGLGETHGLDLLPAEVDPFLEALDHCGLHATDARFESITARRIGCEFGGNHEEVSLDGEDHLSRLGIGHLLANA